MGAPPAERVNILVVDDRHSKLVAMEALLSELGENVVCVPTGADALRQLLEREFAVVLLDVNMPEMDGFETAALIRQRPRLRHVPIIFMTAGSDETRALHGYSLGAVDYILTPVVPEVLCTKVKVFVDLFRMAAELRRGADERVALAAERAARAAAEAARRRAAFLADAGKRMAGSLDLESTVAALLSLVVPELADFAVVRLNGAGEDNVTAFPPGHPLTKSPELTEVMDEVARSLRTKTLEDGPEGTARGLGCPVLARGVTGGVLGLALERGRPPLDAATVMLVEDLCGRAAVAIENCLLYREIQDRDVRKDQFVAMLAHELRNPLSVISSALGVLESLGGREEPAQMARRSVRRQLQSLTRLIDDLVDVARITTGKITMTLAPVNLRDSVQRYIDALASEKRSKHLIELAGHVNGHMPEHVVDLVSQSLNRQGRSVHGSRVLVLGVAYKADIDDIRESPSLDIMTTLEQRGARVDYSDPHVPSLELSGRRLRSVPLTPAKIRGYNCVVIATAHRDVPYAEVARHARGIVDTRNALRGNRSSKILRI